MKGETGWVRPADTAPWLAMKGMRQDYVEALAQIVDLAPEPKVRIDWERVEHKLGRRLPSDYKAFAERFGPGEFDESIFVAVPRGFGPRLDFFGLLEESVEILRSLGADGIPVPYPLYPERGGLISWGSTIEGEVLYWRTDDDDPDRWPVILHMHQTDDWFEFQGSATHVLYAILTGQIAVPVLADGFGLQRHPFTRFGPTPDSGVPG
jgi:hypothetical protein